MSSVSLSLSVVSVRGLRPAAPGVVYVGRTCAGWNGSPLGNPFKRSVVGSKGEAIRRYRAWLSSITQRGIANEPLAPDEAAAWSELLRIARQAAAGEQVKLGCWCAPAACHGETIRDAVLQLVSAGLVWVGPS